ncbi:MAG TPA: hypothetical protein VKZ44_08640, partial [Taishania sp.]|nr:hypothetical protein [Taishania sp.]
MAFSKSKLGTILILIDWIIAIIAWATFYYVRKIVIEQNDFSIGTSFVPGLIIVPIFWILIFTLQGTYIDVRRLYRMKVVSYTLFATILGTITIFFFLLLDDDIDEHTQFYQSLLWVFGIHLVLFLTARIIFVSYIVNKIHKRKAGFRTLLIGGNENALEILQELKQLKKASGHNLVGYVNLNGTDRLLDNQLEYLGKADEQIEQILRKHQIEEVIIALESTEHD